MGSYGIKYSRNQRWNCIDRRCPDDSGIEIGKEANMFEQSWKVSGGTEDSQIAPETYNHNPSRGRQRKWRPSSPFSPSLLVKVDNKLPNLVLLFTLLLSLLLSTAADMWENCEPCSCKWIGGKKAAECTGKKLSMVPNHLSNDLQTIDLSQNEISEIRKSEFFDANLQNVHKLYLRNCTLQYMHWDALKGLNILIELDLSYNRLRELPVGLFNPTFKLRKLLLNHNQIETIVDGLFKDLPYLHKIELKSNRIHTVGLTAFSNLPILSEINLDTNQLTNLKKASFSSLDKLNSLSIMQNPWNCTCALEEFKEFVINRNLYMQPMCHHPSALRGRLWGDITEKFACRPRVLRIRPASRFRSVAENETLECDIYGSPRPNIYWLLNKKPLNSYDNRYKIRTIENYTKNVFITTLTVANVKPQDKGHFTCVATNSAGMDEGHIYIERSNSSGGLFFTGEGGESRTIFGNIYVLIFLLFLGVFAMVISVLTCCPQGSVCPRWASNKQYTNGGSKILTMSERTLIQSKLNESKIEGFSVIIEKQNSDGLDNKSNLKKSQLDKTAFGSHDDEKKYVSLSEATQRAQPTFVNDGHGTSLQPDLLELSSCLGCRGSAGLVLAMTPRTPDRYGSAQNFPMNLWNDQPQSRTKTGLLNVTALALHIRNV